MFNTNFIRHEEKATNEDTIKDVQDAQSSLTQAIQILTHFYAKAGEGNDLLHNRVRLPGPCGSRFTTEIRVRGTNVISSLQVIQSDFARLELETTEAESEAGTHF